MEKLLPIVAGCLALVIRGHLSGKNVRVIELAKPDHVVGYKGKTYALSETGYVMPWIVKGANGEALAGVDGEAYERWIVCEKDMIRIDGGEHLPEEIEIKSKVVK